MTSPIAVVFPVWNRVSMLKETLSSWAEVRGAQDALFQFHVEPGCDEAVELCRAADVGHRSIIINPVRLGHAANVLRAMNTALQVTDYAVLALDDYVVSTDILELHAWHREHYARDVTVLGLSSSRDTPAPSGGLEGIWRCQLIGALTGFHRDKWAILAAHWDEATDKGWWPWVNSRFLQSGMGFDMLFPALSRAADLDGPWPPPGGFTPDVRPQRYSEVTGWRERATGFTRYYVKSL